MRVIDKKRDYYDTAGFVDPSVIFLRHSEELEIDMPHPISYRVNNTGLLGFCGKFYPYIHRAYESYTNEKTRQLIPEQHFYFYSLDEYKKSDFYKQDISYKYRWNRLKEEDFVNFFNHWKDSDKPFVELDAPYFKVKSFNSVHQSTKGIAITNPNLMAMQFGKVMDAPTAFQTIQFYLTNQLVKTKEILEVEDKYRISGHGFDKHSFRHPTKLKDLK